MDPRRKRDEEEDARSEAPTLQQQDWDAIISGAIEPDSVPENGDLRYDPEKAGDAPDEDDDNAYQHSDEALPDDREEAAIRRNPDREGGRFDEV